MVACVACGGQRIDVIPSLPFSHSRSLHCSRVSVVFREIARVNVSLFELSFRPHIARQPRRNLES